MDVVQVESGEIVPVLRHRQQESHPYHLIRQALPLPLLRQTPPPQSYLRLEQQEHPYIRHVEKDLEVVSVLTQLVYYSVRCEG